MSETRKLKVFLCHASQDKPAVRKLYASLLNEGWIEPWLDEEKLLPGMDWDLEIQKALREADLIIICLSKESVAKEGYVQREFKRALSYAEEKPEGTIYIIPLRLDECTPPTKLQQWQWMDYFNDQSHSKLFQSLQLRAVKLGLPISSTEKTKQISLSTAKTEKLHPDPASFTQGGRPVYVFGGMEFVKVVAGDFYMGADDIEAARPQHLLYQLNYDFYVGRYPVTNQEYARYLRSTNQPIVMSRGRESYPVVNIDWFRTRDYIRWLNNMFGHEIPLEHKFILPSEAEWEKAARGVAGNRYPWGNTFDARRCNAKETGLGATSPVGTYSPQGDSAFGAADMAGNIWEWTRSMHKKGETEFTHPYRLDDGRENEDGDFYVLRGGSFMSDQQQIQSANRTWFAPNTKEFDIGFRVAIGVA